MLYSGPAFSATALGDGLVELKFDLAGESVNKLSQAALRDFDAATQALAKDASVKGVIVTSGKSVFIVGADVTEFGAMFAAGEESVAKGVLEVNRMLSRFEDLAGSQGRGDQRRLPRRRTRARTRLRLPRHVDRGVGRLPRSEARHFPGLRRQRAHAARDRRGQRDRVDLHRCGQEARRGAQGRCGGRRRGARGSCATRHSPC